MTKTHPKRSSEEIRVKSTGLMEEQLKWGEFKQLSKFIRIGGNIVMYIEVRNIIPDPKDEL